MMNPTFPNSGSGGGSDPTLGPRVNQIESTMQMAAVTDRGRAWYSGAVGGLSNDATFSSLGVENDTLTITIDGNDNYFYVYGSDTIGSFFNDIISQSEANIILQIFAGYVLCEFCSSDGNREYSIGYSDVAEALGISFASGSVVSKVRTIAVNPADVVAAHPYDGNAGTLSDKLQEFRHRNVILNKALSGSSSSGGADTLTVPDVTYSDTAMYAGIPGGFNTGIINTATTWQEFGVSSGNLPFMFDNVSMSVPFVETDSIYSTVSQLGVLTESTVGIDIIAGYIVLYCRTAHGSDPEASHTLYMPTSAASDAIGLSYAYLASTAKVAPVSIPASSIHTQYGPSVEAKLQNLEVLVQVLRQKLDSM